MSSPNKKKKNQKVSEDEKRKRQLQADIKQLQEDLANDTELHQNIKEKYNQIEDNIVKAKEFIYKFNLEIEDHEQQKEPGQMNAGYVENDRSDDGNDDIISEGTKMKKQKEKKNAERQQKKKKITDDIDRKVKNEIESYCVKVIESHIEKLDEKNMEYNVYHMDKQAIFRLESTEDTFGNIKEKIADYFGLPVEKIFLMNDKSQILLSNILVVDELFPLQTAKIKNETPTIFVTFKKNMTTEDYILGDRMRRDIQQRDQEEREKKLKIDREKDIKHKNIQKKNQTMSDMREIERKVQAQWQKIFGYTTTVLFLAFFCMHIFLATSQYDIGKMNKFNHGIASTFLPGIDVDKQLNSKVFMNVTDVNNYFLNQVNSRFSDASDANVDKDFFLKMNHFIPNIKITKVATQKKECGSDTSNWIGRNKAAMDDKEYGTGDYGYPFVDDSCHWSYGTDKLEQESISDTATGVETQIEFDKKGSMYGSMKGLINQYSGQGFSKEISIDPSNPDFFKEMFQQHIINQGWLTDGATVALIMEFQVYNPNLYMLAKKTFVIEFMEAGGFINFQHETLMMNMRLYRTPFQSLISSILMIIGIVLTALSINQIKQENKAAKLLQNQLALEEGEEGGVDENAQKEEENDENSEERQETEKNTKEEVEDSLLHIVLTCDRFQKTNFIMIFMVISGQMIKYVFDSIAMSAIKDIYEEGDHEEHPNNASIYRFNLTCMFIDSMIIVMGSISLLKYTSLFVPSLDIIILTITDFMANTVRKTLLMITMSYIIFGLLSWQILCYYQYGFNTFGYALLRTCIVFLSGFILNEQKIFYSNESLENLIRYNTFGVTFVIFIVINILIRQVMINIIAIFMHSDFHAAKITAKMQHELKLKDREEQIEAKVIEDYRRQEMAEVE